MKKKSRARKTFKGANRGAFRNNLALSLWGKQNGKCYYCNCLMDWKPAMERSKSIDHLRPLSRGGLALDVFNLVLACRPCNRDKGDLTETEFRAFIAEHGRHPTAKERVALAIGAGRATEQAAA